MVSGYVSLLYSVSGKPLEYWSKQQSQSGRIRKILDSDLLENVIEIQDFEQHGYGTSILCPSDSSQFLNIQLPILVVVIKNLNLHCRLQVQVIDTQNSLHHFQFCNSETEKPNSRGLICRVKIKLETGWNKLELNLSNLMQAAFKAQYSATQRLQICGNCRLRRVYFIDRHYEDQEVCPRLYHGFLDSYMLKWGIRAVERFTQTSTKRNKSRVREIHNSKALSKHYSAENFSADDSSSNATKDSGGHRSTDENFLRCLQMKTDILINDFFNRQSAKLPRTLEFKQQTKLKPYAFPVQNIKQKLFDSTTVSEDALKKINNLQTVIDTSDLSDDKKGKEENAARTIQNNWQYRYCWPQEESSSNADSCKQGALLNSKRTMLERKPRSLLLLSQMKPGSVKEKLLTMTKKCAENMKYNESDTVVN